MSRRRIQFRHLYLIRSGQPTRGYGAGHEHVATFHEVDGNKAWWCAECGGRLPRRHLDGSAGSEYRLHLLGCGRDADA